MFCESGKPDLMEFEDFLRFIKFSNIFINLDSNGNGILEENEASQGLKNAAILADLNDSERQL